MSAALDDARAWIGHRETVEDVIAPVVVDRMSATIGRDDPPAAIGDPLPPSWHWLFCVATAPAGALGPDGHPRRGGFLPPVALPRRMWAGGRLAFRRPLRVGAAVRRESEVADVTVKHGRGGPLVFVLVRHAISDHDGVAVEEEQDIVYREAPLPGEDPEPQAAPERRRWQRTVAPDAVMLFRYSALTFNGHRIHYDHPYATEVEGYPGLVVHGPLTATLLLDLLRRERPRATVARFGYRARRPLFDTAPFTVNGDMAENGAARLWAADADEYLAMEGTAELAAG